MAQRYQYALTDVPFDSSYENVIRFDTREQQEEYFEVSTLFNNAPSVNFDFGNLLDTEMVIKTDDSPLNVMGHNYLIVKNNNDSKPEYLYFFINRAEYLSGGNDGNSTQVRLTLSLDVMNTYLLDTDFGEGAIIRRASLNRWKKVGNNLWMNFDEDSPFRINDNEIVNSPTLVETNRQSVMPLTTKDYSIQDDIVSWLNDNVSGWEYVYLDKEHDYDINKLDMGVGASETANKVEVKLDKISIGDFKYTLNNNLYMSKLVNTIPDYGSICVPIYKSTKRIYVRMTMQEVGSGIESVPITMQYAIDSEGLNAWRQMNNDASYFFTRKISSVAPWGKLNNIEYRIENGNLILIGNPSGTLETSYGSYVNATYCGCSVDNEGDRRTLTSLGNNSTEDYLFSMAISNTTDTNGYGYRWSTDSTFSKKTKPTEAQLKSFDFGSSHGILVGLTQLNYESLYTQEYSLSVPEYTNKDNLISLSTKRKDYCPKLYTAPYSSLKIQCYGEDLEYNISDLWTGTEGTSKVRFMYNEILMPEITKFYVRPVPQGIYTDTYEYNLTGLVSTCDLSVAIVNSAYAEFLANNKNYWLQAIATSLGSNAIPSLLSDFRSPRGYSSIKHEYGQTFDYYHYTDERKPPRLTGSHPTNKTTELKEGYNKLSPMSIAMDVTKVGIDVATNLANSALQLSNVKASPSTMRNATGNSYFLITNKNLDIWCSQMTMLDIDKQRVYDFYYQYGYPLNKIGNIDEYINIRHYFNYLQADLQNIYGKNNANIPNEVRNKIKILFGQGMRFWNVSDNMFKYDKENYENWLVS